MVSIIAIFANFSVSCASRPSFPDYLIYAKGIFHQSRSSFFPLPLIIIIIINITYVLLIRSLRSL
jgi:hypothetical protein